MTDDEARQRPDEHGAATAHHNGGSTGRQTDSRRIRPDSDASSA